MQNAALGLDNLYSIISSRNHMS